MNVHTLTQPSDDSSRIARGAVRWLVRETLGNLVLIGILFGIVGRWDWWNGWALSAIYIFWTLSTAIFILPVNPAMLAERAHLHKDTPKWDLVALSFLGVGTIATYVVASLDVRWGWSSPIPFSAQFTGFIVAVIGNDILLVWAMVSNAFFVATVRIQSERTHTVVSSGPYRFVRHPGYAGAILFHLATPIMLNSLWAFIPAGLSILVLIVRTMLEDKKLQAELDGYKEYAARVHYRLLPGIW
jgi:protein-S-isoprenylcysteine O-methyltransferase Ste14